MVDAIKNRPFIKIKKNHVFKYFYSDFDGALEKHLIVHGIFFKSNSCNIGFPSILRARRLNNFVGVIMMKKIHESIQLNEILYNSKFNKIKLNFNDLFAMIGCSLALLHNATASQEDADLVLGHGDFGPLNIIVNKDGVVHLIDPCPNYFITQNFLNFECRYTDVSHMGACLLSLSGNYFYEILELKKSVNNFRNFLIGYQKKSEVKLDLNLIKFNIKKNIKMYIFWRHSSKYIRLMRLIVSMIRFEISWRIYEKLQ